MTLHWNHSLMKMKKSDLFRTEFGAAVVKCFEWFNIKSSAWRIWFLKIIKQKTQTNSKATQKHTKQIKTTPIFPNFPLPPPQKSKRTWEKQRYALYNRNCLSRRYMLVLGESQVWKMIHCWGIILLVPGTSFRCFSSNHRAAGFQLGSTVRRAWAPAFWVSLYDLFPAAKFH